MPFLPPGVAQTYRGPPHLAAPRRPRHGVHTAPLTTISPTRPRDGPPPERRHEPRPTPCRFLLWRRPAGKDILYPDRPPPASRSRHVNALDRILGPSDAAAALREFGR